MSKLKKLYLDLCMCSIFRSMLDEPLFLFFRDYAKAEAQDEKIKAYSAMAAEIYTFGGSLTDLVRKLVFENENVYIKSSAQGKALPDEILLALDRELSVISEFASLSPDDFMLDMGLDYVSPFSHYSITLSEAYAERVENVDKYGFGVFSSGYMLRVDSDGKIVPITSPDKIALSHFIGYDEERKRVLDNTLAFVEGRPAQNVLLCGDAGTGKSSTVKAVVNHLGSLGVRLIELRKDQLTVLPQVMGRISEIPLKFIIFIDDLSFNKSDDNFSMLKAALEGSASARADNALIYATSNRRHIVRENFEDRDGSDVHRNDAMQEKLSLSERFGLVVYFGKPNKQLYLKIVHELAERNNITLDADSLDIRAEEFALRRGNRSARCAEQFIKSIT